MLNRYVFYRAISTCGDSTTLTDHHVVPEGTEASGYGSASLQILKKLADNTTDANKPTSVYEKYSDLVIIKGQAYVALDLRSSGVNESTATILLREDAAITGEVRPNLIDGSGFLQFAS